MPPFDKAAPGDFPPLDFPSDELSHQERREEHRPNHHSPTDKLHPRPHSFPAVLSCSGAAEERPSTHNMQYRPAPPPPPYARSLPQEPVYTAHSTPPRGSAEKIATTPMALVDLSNETTATPNTTAPHHHHHHHTPDSHATPARDLFSSWAETLHRALSDGTQSADLPLPASAGRVSVPPHLRKHLGECHGVGLVDTKRSGLNPAAPSFDFGGAKVENGASDEARLGGGIEIPTSRLASGGVGVGVVDDDDDDDDDYGDIKSSARTEPYRQARGFQVHGGSSQTHARGGAAMDRPGYEHRVKVMMVRAMEHELDMGRVATEKELMAMTEQDLDGYYGKVQSAHKVWWETDRLARLDV